MKIAIFQADAFTNKLFRGNPAAVCPLDEWLTDGMLQNIAAENNLSETAFFVKEKAGFHIRWFTPLTEVALCGHATLAAAAVIFRKLGYKENRILFDSKSGELLVERDAGNYVLNFPADPPVKADTSKELIEAIGAEPEETLKTKEDLMLVYKDEAEIIKINPDFSALGKITSRGVIVTAPGTDVDFVSRFFAPAVGINEDPVTGSTHTSLCPYWSEKLNKNKLTAHQLSSRGGHLLCNNKGKRVEIAGKVAFYLQGLIEV